MDFHLSCSTGDPGCDRSPSAHHPEAMAQQPEAPVVSLSVEAETSASPGEGRDGMDERLTLSHLTKHSPMETAPPRLAKLRRSTLPASHLQVRQPRQQPGATRATTVTWNMVQDSRLWGKTVLGRFGSTDASVPLLSSPRLMGSPRRGGPNGQTGCSNARERGEPPVPPAPPVPFTLTAPKSSPLPKRGHPLNSSLPLRQRKCVETSN